ncbi:MAG: transcription termination/antitermination protein NusG [Deltaproteobacteria bacterium]|nr:transcription termination/antitermination protein NusG [Deltaproteobacteria bacterium]
MPLRWYVVHTFSGFEHRVKQALEDKIQKLNLSEQIAEVILPMENVTGTAVTKDGSKRTTQRKLFPGYLLVKMELNEITWQIIKEIPKVSGFLGGKNKPEPIPDEEAERVLSQMLDGTQKPKPKYTFEEGDDIKVVDGPFNNFTGVVEEVNEDKAKLKVLINIFGRPTPVELEFHQVDKLG